MCLDPEVVENLTNWASYLDVYAAMTIALMVASSEEKQNYWRARCPQQVYQAHAIAGAASKALELSLCEALWTLARVILCFAQQLSSLMFLWMLYLHPTLKMLPSIDLQDVDTLVLHDS